MFIAEYPRGNRRGKPHRIQIDTSENQPKILILQILPRDIDAVNRTAVASNIYSTLRGTPVRLCEPLLAVATIATNKHVADLPGPDILVRMRHNRLRRLAGQAELLPGRQRLRDQVLLRLMYRHGLRASEAKHTKWSDFDLTPGSGPKTFHVRRVKGSNDSVHTLDRDEILALRKLKAVSTSPSVFVSERGGPLSPDMIARSPAAALADVELMHMIRKGQMKATGRLRPAQQFYSLAS